MESVQRWTFVVVPTNRRQECFVLSHALHTVLFEMNLLWTYSTVLERAVWLVQNSQLLQVANFSMKRALHSATPRSEHMSEAFTMCDHAVLGKPSTRTRCSGEKNALFFLTHTFAQNEFAESWRQELVRIVWIQSTFN